MDISKYVWESDAVDVGELMERHKLFEDTYLFVFTKKLVIVKTDSHGQIIRMSIFGNREV